MALVNGIGGIGKTTLAESYVAEFFDDYKHLAWITLDSDDVLKDFADAKGLQSNLKVNPDIQNLKDLFLAITRGLKNVEGTPNLLILDNATAKLKPLSQYLPSPPGWHVLVTSREKISGYKLLSLDTLSEEEAYQLFIKHCTIIDDEEKIRALLKSIDYHTLTVEILAKTAEHQHKSIEELLSAIQKNIDADIYIEHGGKVQKVYSYLSNVFNMSNLNEDDRWLIKQFNCLPFDPMGYDFLFQLINPEATERSDNFGGILNGLAKRGWLQIKEVDGSTGYQMHKVISEITSKINPVTLDDIASLLSNVTSRLRIDQANDNPVDKFQWVQFGNILNERFLNSKGERVSLLQNNFGAGPTSPWGL